MKKNAVTNRLLGWKSTQRYASPELALDTVNKKNLAKPARITRNQLSQVLSVVQRMAAGGDMTCTVDAAACVPILQKAIHAAPRGPRVARAQYKITQPDGTAHMLSGAKAAARFINRAEGTLMNAVSKGKGAAEFPGRDEHGNPAVVRVERLA